MTVRNDRRELHGLPIHVLQCGGGIWISAYDIITLSPHSRIEYIPSKERFDNSQPTTNPSERKEEEAYERSRWYINQQAHPAASGHRGSWLHRKAAKACSRSNGNISVTRAAANVEPSVPIPGQGSITSIWLVADCGESGGTAEILDGASSRAVPLCRVSMASPPRPFDLIMIVRHPVFLLDRLQVFLRKGSTTRTTLRKRNRLWCSIRSVQKPTSAVTCQEDLPADLLGF